MAPLPDEQEWLRRLRSGSQSAFEELLDRYERRVYNLALRLLGDATEAEDAAQDIFVQVHRSLPKFKGESRLDTWVYRIAVNVCLQRRRKKHWPTGPMPEDDLLPAGEADDPFDAAANTELRRRLERAVSGLPEGQREAVLLHGLQGMSYAEVAAALDCPIGTVKSRISAAFKRLRGVLAPYVLAEGQVPVSCSEGK